MPYLSLHSLTRRFGATAGVFDLSLGVERGGILALLGPSGSGKTTTLRLLGGFERPDGGRIAVEDEELTHLRPERRRFGMVFQHYALFPHLDVGQNIAFGLESLGIRGAASGQRIAEALTLVGLDGFERRGVAELSGGQQQRIALARALAPEPRVLLLDEPLSNLDPALRERTRRELRTLIRRVGITTVIVTHEQEDAFDLADTVAVLNEGRLEQVGTPEALYHHPATAFVARFIGRSSWIAGRAGPGERRSAPRGDRGRRVAPPCGRRPPRRGGDRRRSGAGAVAAGGAPLCATRPRAWQGRLPIVASPARARTTWCGPAAGSASRCWRGPPTPPSVIGCPSPRCMSRRAPRTACTSSRRRGREPGPPDRLGGARPGPGLGGGVPAA